MSTPVTLSKSSLEPQSRAFMVGGVADGGASGIELRMVPLIAVSERSHPSRLVSWATSEGMVPLRELDSSNLGPMGEQAVHMSDGVRSRGVVQSSMMRKHRSSKMWACARAQILRSREAGKL